MCGIFCVLSSNGDQNSRESLLEEFKVFKNFIAQRGPNSLQTEFVASKDCNLLIAASVLWLQGRTLTVQPIKSDDAVFIYNGDLFDECSVSRQNGDTKIFFEALQSADNIIDTLSQFQGPFAFIFLKNNKLYFGRDAFGRRSLLIGKNGSQLVVTSVAKRRTKFSFIELPCTGIFSIDLGTKQWQLLPWRRRNKNFDDKKRELETFLCTEISCEQVEFMESRVFAEPTEAQTRVLNEILKSSNVLDYFCQIYSDRITKLRDLLASSVKKRILTQPKFCQNCFKHYACNHAITGLLFSGGVDCAILALLAHSFVEETRPIDLINVAFEKDGFNAPDRMTGLDTLKELQSLCPRRTWNFVQVNVTREELDSWRKERISDLIYPLNSILDDSLGCALWFASRGVSKDYRSPCRTLLVGMGADELFGGYSRHRAAFEKNNWRGLHEVLEEDWQNLPHRNLARDDRVVSDHGRQLRTPYLDEEVVKFVRSLSSWDRTVPSKGLPQGIGEKIFLRSLAHHLGLKDAATFQKRALQFGSRIANSKEKGHQTAERLQVL